MRYRAHGRLRRQVDSLRRQFLQQRGLPFADVLSSAGLEGALREVPRWNDRIFAPLVTPWVFLGQALAADQSCRAAVAGMIARRASQGLEPRSSETGAYRQARRRLPEGFFAAAARLVGRNLDARVDRRWLRKGRRACLFDGSTVSMPDTEENRREYPLAYDQVPGTNFAIARIGAIISLSRGAILDPGICRYAGNGQGEVGLLRRLWDALRPGDVLLGDRLMSGRVGMHLLKRRGVDTVSRLSAHRRADFRKGTRPGRGDHLVVRRKPTSIRSVDRETYSALPDSITVREARSRAGRPGFRTRSIVVVTTPLDPREATREELASLYRARWNDELDLRSIKVALRMDRLRCKAPELVREEIWAHALGCNPIRTVMAQAAAGERVPPRSISFKATLRVLEAFRPVIAALVPAARATGRRSTGRCSGPSRSTASPTGPTGPSPAGPSGGPRGTTA
jgi:hypothetical protein